MEFDSFYKDLEDRFRGSAGSIKKRLEIYSPFLSEIGSYTKSSIAVDLGCGRCEWLELARLNNVDATGIDIDDFMILDSLSKGYNVKKYDALDYLKCVEAETLGLITAFHIVEHLEFDYLRRLINEAYRCLAPGGVIVIETPNPENLYTASVSFNLDPSHKKPLPPALLSFVVGEGGFERINVLRLNENKINNGAISLIDVIYNVSPDYCVIAQKSGYAISANVDRLFLCNTGLLLDSLAHDYDGNLREVREDISIVREDLSNMLTSSREQGEWVLSFSQQQADHIKILEEHIRTLEDKINTINAHPLFSFMPFLKKKITELYWTITRILGYGYLHDGSTAVGVNSPTIDSAKSFGSLALIGRSLPINLAYLRINQAVELIKKNHFNQSSVSTKNTNDQRALMAFVTPFPPQKTGIANYSKALLPKLGEIYRIVVIVEAGVQKDHFIFDNDICFKDHHWFEENANIFDRVVYQFGNSEYHTYMLDLLDKFPGIVVLHDFYLGHFIGALDQKIKFEGIWAEELYRSEGYGALIGRYKDSDIERTILECPVNFSIIQKSLGAIFHNNYSVNLSRKFYGEKILSHVGMVPLGKTIHVINNREKAREYLGILPNDIVVCSFGFLGPTKLSQDIFEAWNHALFNVKTVHLYFVGEAPPSDYCAKLQKAIDECDNKKVNITGYVNEDDYQNYLASCDIAIQLRVNSRGETSAALLDCMGAGIATIVLNQGPFSEIPDNCVYKIRENINVREISISIGRLVSNPKLRSELGKNAKHYVDAELNFAILSQKYSQEIERFYQFGPKVSSMLDICSIANSLVADGYNEEDVLSEAIGLAYSLRLSSSRRQLFIDVSALVKEDLNTGIQRYVKAQITELIMNPPIGFSVEPIYLDEEHRRPFFRYAKNFTLKLLDIVDVKLPDNAIAVGGDDIYYMPDLCYWSVQKCDENHVYSDMKSYGVKLFFVVFDILPISLPQFFPPKAKSLHTKWLNSILRNANGVICISNSVKQDIYIWMETANLQITKDVSFDVLHLGANFNYSNKTEESIKNKNSELLVIAKSKITFLMVGTIEPRKGHLEVIDAFDGLWDDGLDITLIIVGVEGWKNVKDEERRAIPQIISRLKNHPQSGHRIFWIDDASDCFLEELYNSASCFIMASFGEGFGLPLIEAARHNLPIIARDIPVFREVIGDNALFFKDGNNSSLKNTIQLWLDSRRQNKTSSSLDIPVLTWRENVEKLIKLICLDSKSGNS